jgi:hypothetical protein
MPEPTIDPTTQPVLPQIKSTLVNAIILFIGIPIVVYLGMYWVGELNQWSDLKKYVDHVLFADTFTTLGWIVMKSPIAPRFLAILNSVRSLPGGGQQTMQVLVDQQAAEGKVKATLDPTGQSVTIEKTSAKPEDASAKGDK